jgi:hypothetical protein
MRQTPHTTILHRKSNAFIEALVCKVLNEGVIIGSVVHNKGHDLRIYQKQMWFEGEILTFPMSPYSFNDLKTASAMFSPVCAP